jgi:hypothetical protein
MAVSVVSKKIFDFRQCLEWLVHIFIPYGRDLLTFFLSIMKGLNVLLIDLNFCLSNEFPRLIDSLSWVSQVDEYSVVAIIQGLLV